MLVTRRNKYYIFKLFSNTSDDISLSKASNITVTRTKASALGDGWHCVWNYENMLVEGKREQCVWTLN